MDNFVHLHLHTQYSLLDGAAGIADVISRAKELGMESVAITDHGVMYGAIEFYFEAVSKGIKPIIGCEVYTSPNSRFDKNHNTDKNYGHLVLLCENMTGYKNLMTLVTHAHTEGFYYKPRVDMELLSKHSEGLIALSACLRGDVPRAFLAGGYDAAVKKVNEYIEIFGKENFFLEIQNHGIEEEQQIAEALVRMSEELGVGLVATNDVHYVRKEDALIQDVLMCIQTGKKLSDDDRMKMEAEEYYFKSSGQMQELFGYVPQALENTVRISQRCNLVLEENILHLPKIKLNTTLSHADYLEMLCLEGIAKKYGKITEELKKRLDYELSVINSMGYTDYFLIVYDFIKYSKDNGIAVGPGRGSAAGSLVSYALNITEIDPVEYNLIFERFLNPERISMPDIDIDFCYERRDEVRAYVAKKYGADRVAQIITFGTMAARAAIRDVARVTGTDPGLTNRIAKLVPRVLNIKLRKAIEEIDELGRLYQTDPEVRRLLDIAMAIEGFPRHASTHAAGVVIGDAPLTSYVPLQNSDTGLLTQYPMAALEKIGLLKMDFLGLRNLTVIEDTINAVNVQTGGNLSVNSIPINDERTFELISSGDTDGVFQLENPGLQSFLRKFRPQKLEDIVLTTSLYRPGPMDQLGTFLENVRHPENIRYAHPLLRPILESTYGVVVYQEQVMKIVRSLAGYSLGRADLVRRTMAKKKHAEMLREREIFIHGLEEHGKIVIPGAVRNGVDEKCANEIFDSLIDFANYAFNKSHAACYALVAYRTAYLKAHYSAHYLAAVLKNYAGNMHKAVKYLNSFKKYGISLLKPDVQRSGPHFMAEGSDVRFGLCWIRNVGTQFPAQIEFERHKNGQFKSFYDFIFRMSSYDINKRSVENMIKCGCFDSLYPNRRVLIYNYERYIDECRDIAAAQKVGQLSFFGPEDNSSASELTSTGAADFSLSDKMAYEYELSGMFFSGNPLDEHKMKLSAFSEVSLDMLYSNEKLDGTRVNVCGRISELSARRTKSGKTIASMNLSDYSGTCTAVAFESTISKYSGAITEGSVVAMCAVMNLGDDEATPELIIQSCILLDELTVDAAKKLYVKVKNNTQFLQLKSIFAKYPGDNNLVIYFEDSGSVIKSDSNHRVCICNGIFDELCTKLGYDNVKIK